MNDKNYPLIEVIRIKKRRLDEAERVLREKKLILEKEQEKLETCEKEFQEAKNIFDTYLQKLRDAMDQGEGASKIQQHKLHLKDLKDHYIASEKKLEAQKKVVKSCEAAVEQARLDYMQKEKEVEKLHIHKKEWQEVLSMEEKRAEEIKMDEISTSSFARKKKE